MKRKPSFNAIESAKKIFQTSGGIMRTREALECGIHYSTLYSMRDSGLLEKMSRGVYRLSSMAAPNFYDIATVAKRVPNATICLLSALSFHGVGTQIPSEVCIAIGPKDRKPQIEYPPIRVFRYSGDGLTAGIEEFESDGITVHVYCVGKTIADCFKFRNKIGLDVAIEAMKEALESQKTTPAEIMGYATINRVAIIIRPYLEILT